MDGWTRTASLLHSNGDAMDLAVHNGRIAGVRGRLDPKDLYGWQADNSADLLTRPPVRDGDRLAETDWDTAMDRVVAKSRELLDGPGGWGRFGFYTSGQLFLEEYYTLGVTGSYTDVDHCDAIALWGHNVAETQTVLWMRMLDRRHGADPPAMLAVDPARRPWPARPTCTSPCVPAPTWPSSSLEPPAHRVSQLP